VTSVIEHVGAATWDESVKSLKSSGTLVTCGATTGPSVGIDLRHLFARQLRLLGSYMGTMGELYEVLSHAFAGAAETSGRSGLSAERDPRGARIPGKEPDVREGCPRLCSLSAPEGNGITSCRQRRNRL